MACFWYLPPLLFFTCLFLTVSFMSCIAVEKSSAVLILDLLSWLFSFPKAFRVFTFSWSPGNPQLWLGGHLSHALSGLFALESDILQLWETFDLLLYHFSPLFSFFSISRITVTQILSTNIFLNFVSSLIFIFIFNI